VADTDPKSALATIPAVKMITEAAVPLMGAAAEKPGLAPDGQPQFGPTSVPTGADGVRHHDCRGQVVGMMGPWAAMSG
jgi:hypothetical protein